MDIIERIKRKYRSIADHCNKVFDEYYGERYRDNPEEAMFDALDEIFEE
jgi:hypothetical protein